MPSIQDREYMYNPDNNIYLRIAQALEMDWEKNWRFCREMYEGLDAEHRESLLDYVENVESDERWKKMKKRQEMKNRSSGINIATMFAA
jgi:hypothetical protein